jgi:hypothetical protein
MLSRETALRTRGPVFEALQQIAETPHVADRKCFSFTIGNVLVISSRTRLPFSTPEIR